MNKKLITALILTFIAVKNPVISLVEIQTALAQESKNKQVSAVSEADIAENLESLYRPEKTKTIEEKTKLKLIAYQKALNEERIKKQKAEEAKIISENINNASKLKNAGLSAKFLTNYIKAEKVYGVPWEVIAAVHFVETHQSGNTVVTSYAGAQGPMQFMPSTFRAYAQDGNGDGVKNIGNVDDAIYTAAKYMAANGGANGNLVAALYRYNHDMGYVNHVLSIARSIGLNK